MAGRLEVGAKGKVSCYKHTVTFCDTKDAKKNGLITGKFHYVDAILNASFNLCVPEYDIVIICGVQLCNAPL